MFGAELMRFDRKVGTIDIMIIIVVLDAYAKDDSLRDLFEYSRLWIYVNLMPSDAPIRYFKHRCLVRKTRATHARNCFERS